jgi:hypothetical protein
MGDGQIVLVIGGGLLVSVVEGAVFDVTVEPMKKGIDEWERSAGAFGSRAGIVGGQ